MRPASASTSTNFEIDGSHYRILFDARSVLVVCGEAVIGAGWRIPDGVDWDWPLDDPELESAVNSAIRASEAS